MLFLSAWWLSPITKKNPGHLSQSSQVCLKKQKQLEHNILFDCMGLFGQKKDTVPHVIQRFETSLFPKKCNSAANNHAHVHHVHTFPIHFPTFSIYKMALRSIHQLTSCGISELICEMLLELVQSAPIALRAKAQVHPRLWTNCCNEKAKKPPKNAEKDRKGTFERVKLARSEKNSNVLAPRGNDLTIVP